MAKLRLKNPPDGWTFDTYEKMSERVKLLGEDGLTGVAIKSYMNQQELVWRLTFNAAGVGEQHVYLSPASDPNMATWLVRDGQTLTAYTDAAFAEKFEIDEES